MYSISPFWFLSLGHLRGVRNWHFFHSFLFLFFCCSFRLMLLLNQNRVWRKKSQWPILQSQFSQWVGLVKLIMIEWPKSKKILHTQIFTRVFLLCMCENTVSEKKNNQQSNVNIVGLWNEHTNKKIAIGIHMPCQMSRAYSRSNNNNKW